MQEPLGSETSSCCDKVQESIHCLSSPVLGHSIAQRRSSTSIIEAPKSSTGNPARCLLFCSCYDNPSQPKLMESSLQEQSCMVRHKPPNFLCERTNIGVACPSGMPVGHGLVVNQLPMMHSTYCSYRRHSDSAVALSPNVMSLAKELTMENANILKNREEEASKSQSVALEASGNPTELMILQHSCQACLAHLLPTRDHPKMSKFLMPAHLKCATPLSHWLCNAVSKSSVSQPLPRGLRPCGRSLDLPLLHESLQCIISQKTNCAPGRTTRGTETALHSESFRCREANVPGHFKPCHRVCVGKTSLKEKKKLGTPCVQSSESKLISKNLTQDVVGKVLHLILT